MSSARSERVLIYDGRTVTRFTPAQQYALAKFVVAYADQTERDYAVLVRTVRSGRVEALVEEA
jgi:hypothetical protein